MRGKNGVHERQNPPQNHKKDQVLETFQLTVLLLRFLAQIRWHRARFLQLRVSIRRRDWNEACLFAPGASDLFRQSECPRTYWTVKTWLLHPPILIEENKLPHFSKMPPTCALVKNAGPRNETAQLRAQWLNCPLWLGKELMPDDERQNDKQ